MAESRQDYLNWINSLLQLHVTKIEDLGRGDIFCQIFDSIFLDVPLKKVKFNAKQEFEYITNFKVLQTVFDKHKIPNQILVERLVKLRFQDNFEFCQFVKKFWDTHFPGHPYDAIARRNGQTVSHALKPVLSLPSSGYSSTPVTVPKRQPSSATISSSYSSLNSSSSELQTALLQITTQLQEAQTNFVSMEKERDFYFNKLRQIELELQAAQEKQESMYNVKKLLQVLYTTEEGFATDYACAPSGLAAGQDDSITMQQQVAIAATDMV